MGSNSDNSSLTLSLPPAFGRFRFIRPLGATSYAERWMALHEIDHTSHTVYRFHPTPDKVMQRRFLSAMQAAALLREPHLSEIQHYAFDAVGRPCLVTPFIGNHEGLITLRSLSDLKGGRLSPLETERALVHILEGLRYAHQPEVGGPSHGELAMDHFLVDRHGRVIIELYGVARRLLTLGSPSRDLAQDEVRSVVQIGYELLTGLAPDEPRLSISRLIRNADPAWDRWFDRGLSGIDGFASADEALARLPSASPAPDTIAEAKPRGFFSRFRWPTKIGR